VSEIWGIGGVTRTGKTEAFGEILVPLPFHPPKIPQIGIWHWTGPPRREADV